MIVTPINTTRRYPTPSSLCARRDYLREQSRFTDTTHLATLPIFFARDDETY